MKFSFGNSISNFRCKNLAYRHEPKSLARILSFHQSWYIPHVPYLFVHDDKKRDRLRDPFVCYPKIALAAASTPCEFLTIFDLGRDVQSSPVTVL